MSTITQELQTVGIIPPTDFPIVPYNALHNHCQNKQISKEYRSGWNAVAYRFKGAADSDADFQTAIVRSDHEGRYLQERALFGFFTSGLATIETFCYAIYFVAASKKPADFPSTANPRSISIDATLHGLRNAFQSDRLIITLASIHSSAELKEWKEVRNVLSHRSAPGRAIEPPFAGPQSPDEWQLNGIVLDSNTTASRRTWLAASIGQLVNDAHAFVLAYV